MEHIFQYNNQNITFQLGNGDVMVNATQMAKPFGKTTKDYLRTQSSDELISALSLHVIFYSHLSFTMMEKQQRLE